MRETFIPMRALFTPSMADVLLLMLVAVAILFPFLVVPEILERWGYDAKSRFARLVVWSCFLVLILVPAVLSGVLWNLMGPAGWLLLLAAVAFAMLWEYHRLHPWEFP